MDPSNPIDPASIPVRQTFPRSYRLSGRRAFAAVYAGKFRQARAPLLIYAISNDTGHGRLGLSVSRKVGTAPQRNRIKRLLRDAFRTTPAIRNSSVDWLIVVRPHSALSLDDYQKLLASLGVPAHLEPGPFGRR